MFRLACRVSVVVVVALISANGRAEGPPAKPNVLWITCEDMSPDLGCYGDAYAVSPTIDRLAADGVRYTRCFTHIGVCAPSRSGLLTGMYPPSIGSQHMRSQTVLPDYVHGYPQYLREAGYYCTNNSKTDYNFTAPKGTWDESSNKAHWKNRPDGKPFFAVFNLTITHESQVRAPEKAYQKNIARLKPDQIHDPAKAPVPPYHPDTPVVRKDWAHYYDNITAMDYQVADLLKELDDAGLSDETIVFFYSDHGAGMPRSKRWLYDSSVHVPLIVRYPKAWQTAATKAGTVNDELVAFVDLGPTVMSLAGVPTPEHMQGRAFLGPHKAAEPREYVYGCRDRMDERVDMIRSVRDKRFKYIRNYQWWKPYAQNINYMNEMPTMQEWRRLAAEGKLNAAQSLFMAPQKPREELYDCDTDPHEISNLAADPKYADELKRLRAAHEAWTVAIKDTGYVPEYMLQEIMQLLDKHWRDEPRMAKTSQYLRGLQLDLEKAIDDKIDEDALVKLLEKEIKEIGDDAGPYRVLGLFVRIADLLPEMDDAANRVASLRGGFEKDPSFQDPAFLTVRIALASATIRAAKGKIDVETVSTVRPALVEGMKSDNKYLRHEAVLAVDELGPQAVEFLDDIRAMLKIDDGYAARVGEFILSTREKN